MNDLVDPARRQFEFMNSQIQQLEKLNAELLDALKMVAYARPTKYVNADGTDTPFIISKNVLEKVKQAIAKAERKE